MILLKRMLKGKDRPAMARRTRSFMTRQALADEDGAASHFAKSMAGHPDHDMWVTMASAPREFSLPGSTVYTIAILGPAMFRWSASKGTRPIKGAALVLQLWKVVQRCFLLYTYSIVISFFILYMLWPFAYHALDSQVKGNCDANTSALLRFACLSTYTVAVIADLHETWTMLDWLVAVWRNNRGFAKACLELRVMADGAKAGELDPSFALTCWHTCWCFLGVIVPKVACALVLWVIGVGFIALAADNRSMIVDMLAITFVLEIDELIFISFSSTAMQTAVASLPPVIEKPRSVSDAKVLPFGGEPKVDHGVVGKAVDVVRTTGKVTAGAAEKATEVTTSIYRTAWNYFYLLGLDKVITLSVVSAIAFLADSYVCGTSSSPPPFPPPASPP